MAEYHNILSKCDAALAAYIISNGVGTTDDVYSLKRSLVKDTLPCTICESRKATPETPYAGDYNVSALIKVRSQGIYATTADNESGQPADDSNDRVADTFAIFFLSDGQSGEDLGKAITTAAADAHFTCLSCKVEGVEQGVEREGMGWCDILHLELICAPSTISD
jgi:hypothetical protein